MTCVCGSLECTCQGICLCTLQDCACERCDDLRSGRTLRSEDLRTLTRKGEKLQVFAEEKLETVENSGVQRLSFSANYQEPNVAYSRCIQEAKSSTLEKSLESCRSSCSSPFTKSSLKGLTPLKRSFSDPQDITPQYSTKYMDQSINQSKSDFLALSDSETITPVKRIRCNDPSDTEIIPMEVDSSSEAEGYSTGNKSIRVDESTPLNTGQSKFPEVPTEASSSRNILPNPSFNQIHLPGAVQLSPGRKYTVMIRKNILSSSTEPGLSRPSSSAENPLNPAFQRHLSQLFFSNTKYVSKSPSSQKHGSGFASSSFQHKSSGASEFTQKSMQSPEVCQNNSNGVSESPQKPVESPNVHQHSSSRRCMPIISPPPAGIGSNRFDFSWRGSPQRPKSVESYFDQSSPCSVLRASGNLDDMFRMNRVVRQFVDPLDKFKQDLYQHHARSAVEEAENQRSRLSMAPDSAESSSIKVDSQNTERASEGTSAEAPTVTHGVIQGDPELDDPFILKGLPYDLTSEESNSGSGTPSDTEGQ